jgi:glycyl-tRNA synthetase (class II)
MGVELKRNIKETWWRDMVINPPDGPDGRQIEMVGVDCSIIMNPKVWEASGHVGGFSDPMMDCKQCKARFRADQGFLVRLRRPEQTEIFATCCVEAGRSRRSGRGCRSEGEKALEETRRW